MLLGNYSVYNRLPLKFLGGSTASPEVNHAPNFRRGGRLRNRQLQDQTTAAYPLWAVPSSYYPPYTWMMPNKIGELASRFNITGSGGVTATAQSGYNIEAALTGAGDIPNSVSIGLIVSIAAAISASGGITSAATEALASMVAALTGSSSVAATAAGLADLGAVLTGAGVVVAGNTALMDIEANIRGYGELTPEGLRDAVWSAILTNYPDAGTAGNTLALAGSGGVDYDTLATAVWTRTQRTLSADGNADVASAIAAYAIESGWTTETLLRVFAAVLAGKVSGAGTGTETFRGINDDKDRVVATVDSNGNRTAITLDGS